MLLSAPAPIWRPPTLPPDTRIRLYDVTYGKYARRVVARIETDQGRDLGAALICAGLATPGSKGVWCG